jgi:hypothetical protein
VFFVFRIRGFFFPNIFCCFFCCESWWGHCSWIVFSQIYFTFFMIYASRLRFYEPFNSMWSSVYVLCWFFSLSTRCQVFRLLTDFVCLYNYEFWLSLCKIVRSSVILLLPLFTWITGHIHRSIVDKIDPTSEYVEMVKKYTLSITLGYIVLWNVIGEFI